MISHIVAAAALMSSYAVSYASAAASPSGIEQFYGKTVSETQVLGLKRIEKDAVLSKVQTKAGSTLNRDTIREDIQALFGMGLFEEIAVEGEFSGTQVRVSFSLKERAVISKVEFDGNERISTSDLKEIVKVKEWSILDINKIREDVALIQKHYEEKGFYLAKVAYDLKRVKSQSSDASGSEEVEVTYRISDYEKVQIKKITFLNNKRFSDTELKNVFRETKEGGFFSFITDAGNFKESSFKQDLQMLYLWYLDHGYLKFRHENPVVTVSEDKRWLYITIYVDEGEQYKIGNVDFSGDLLFPKEELQDLLTLKSGDTFHFSKRNQDLQKLTEKYQDLGYAFVNVNPKVQQNDETKIADLDYSFEKGNLVYFGEINIQGNTKTHDKVIRRELKIHEGELYSGTKMRESRENVERLGYFQPGEVIFNQITPKGKLDRVDIEISIKERNTGTVTLGAGFGTQAGFFFTGQLSEINLFGRGQQATFSAQYSLDASQRFFNIGFTDPYIFDTRWSAGGDVYLLKVPYTNKYNTSKLGFDLKLGYPIFEYVQALATYKLEDMTVDPPIDVTLPASVSNSDRGLLSSVVLAVVRDKRNNRFETTEGNYQNVSIETAGIGGTKRFVKGLINSRYYKRLIGDLVFRNNIQLGAITGLGGDPPSSEKFYLGGQNDMKGFKPFLLGPTRTGTDGAGNAIPVPLGGNYEAFALFELEHPIIREAGIKGVVFFDVGNTWDTFSLPRLDAGFGIRWFSPIGPLRFEFGYPLDRRPGEDQMVFNFFIGPPF